MEQNFIRDFLTIKFGSFNISKIIVAYLIGYLVEGSELGKILALDLLITDFFHEMKLDQDSDSSSNCSCKK